jgi:acyl CoA:acetate/3-ketoacid CoA transferase beta subunit
MNFAVEDIIVVCMARQVKDGEVVAQGIATPLVAAAYLLARKTHAPHLYFVSAIGQGICRQPAPLSITRVESLWLDRALTNVSFVRAAADILPTLRPKEFFRPGQIDAYGNFNNIAFGKDYHRPRLRLPGTGGIPDVTTFIHDICLYVPRHSRVTFVKKLDFCSGLGFHPERTCGSGPICLITDLGQFDFGDPQEPDWSKRRMRLLTVHPGATIEKIKARTAFDLEIAPDVHETPWPEEEEIRLLNEEIDPFGIRRLETLGGAERRQLLRQIIQNER